ncbi:hypothetical protein Q7F20_12015 [Curtobacterium sp. A7_M15]|uniref:hypothetical protein n=1 Tax=Curtobacterium sp. A7_M15 TaxID=3065241 RepID=UPI002737E6E9|nr:hypothetical protein [Curtobacterium sp. A7_M15]MDP4334095.1 hypothetical protein [Curtobacterium sp. A7_M15]
MTRLPARTTVSRTTASRTTASRTAVFHPAVSLTAVALAAAGALSLAACSTTTTTTTTSATGPAASSSALGEGFLAAGRVPAPESTVSPAPGSWSAVHPPSHYEVVLLSDQADAEAGRVDPADGRAARTLAAAVASWAAAEDVSLTRVVAADPDDRVAAVARAVDEHPDLVISVGDDMVDPLAAVSPSALHQQFLVLGAEIAEPTSNVTAADWTGGGFRGEGLGPSSHHDPSTFTPERAGRALRAGVAAVLNDLTGIVVWVR